MEIESLRLLDMTQANNGSVFEWLPSKDFCQNFAKEGVMHT